QLNLLLPAAGDYTISTVYDQTATIFRNDAGVNGYPFNLGNIFSITGNNATSGADTTYYKNFYYYFYDMHVRSAGCPSTARQPVTLSKPLITQNGTILNSSFTTGNQWYLDGNAIAGATDATFSPRQSGNYAVGVSLGSGCQALSDNFVYVLAGGSNGSDIGLAVYPVPTSSLLYIIFNAKTNATLTLSLTNAAGQAVYNAEQSVNQGNFSTTLDGSNLPPGVYILKLLLGQKAYYNKIIIVK